MSEVLYNQEHICKYSQNLWVKWDCGSSRVINFEAHVRIFGYHFEHCINFFDHMNCHINEQIKWSANSSSVELLPHKFIVTSLAPSHIQDSDVLLLSRAEDDPVVRGYAHCKSVAVSSVSKAIWAIREIITNAIRNGRIGAVRYWWSDQNTKYVALKLSSTTKANTLFHQWLGGRCKSGAFDIVRDIMKQCSASLPH